ncbi:MAG TPA: CHAP domain-containing protein [Rhizomicrobium sp.]|nr:CHAP domain-containing protein [Rhizomicrobium sp.]
MTRTIRAIRFPRVLIFSALLSTLFCAPAFASVPQDIEATVNDVAGDTAAPPQPPAPATETPLHRLYCVEYARMRSGLEIFGDAKLWWARARDIYQEFTAPAADAVMVFAGSKRIARGHVAVVTALVSPREIRVDQANWQNHGEIDRNTPVLDVSAGNDWSKVRVWDVRSGQFGGHVYAIKGFIARNAPVVESTGL